MKKATRIYLFAHGQLNWAYELGPKGILKGSLIVILSLPWLMLMGIVYLAFAWAQPKSMLMHQVLGLLSNAKEGMKYEDLITALESSNVSISEIDGTLRELYYSHQINNGLAYPPTTDRPYSGTVWMVRK